MYSFKVSAEIVSWRGFATGTGIAAVTHLERHYDKVSIRAGKERLTTKAGLDMR